MYGSRLKALKLTCSARAVIFAQIQTSKIAKCSIPDTRQRRVRPSSTSHLFHVATAFKFYIGIQGHTRPHSKMSNMTSFRARSNKFPFSQNSSIKHQWLHKLSKVAHDLVPAETLLTLELDCRTRHEYLFPHETPSRGRRYFAECMKSHTTV